jgi:hypothetical protein
MSGPAAVGRTTGLTYILGNQLASAMYMYVQSATQRKLEWNGLILVALGLRRVCVVFDVSEYCGVGVVLAVEVNSKVWRSSQVQLGEPGVPSDCSWVQS